MCLYSLFSGLFIQLYSMKRTLKVRKVINRNIIIVKWENLCPCWYIQWLQNRLLLIFFASLKTELQMELMKSNKTIGIKYIEAQITWFMCTIYVQRERNFKTDEGGDVVGDRSSREGRLPILGGMIKYYDNHPGGNDKNLIQSSWGEW